MKNPMLLSREYGERIRDQFNYVADGTISVAELPKIVELITLEFIGKHITNTVEILTTPEGGEDDTSDDADDSGSTDDK